MILSRLISAYRLRRWKKAQVILLQMGVLRKIYPEFSGTRVSEEYLSNPERFQKHKSLRKYLPYAPSSVRELYQEVLDRQHRVAEQEPSNQKANTEKQ